MERRDFLIKSSLLAALGAVSIPIGSATEPMELEDALKPTLLKAMKPLEHNGGMGIRVWMRSAMTNGLFSSVECAVAPKIMGPPPHFHDELDEIMFVLEGIASVVVEDEIVQVEAGGWHLRPRKIKHTFFNASDKPLRFVDMYFNQPFEEYLERLFFELTAEKGFLEGSDAKIQEMIKLNEQFGVRFPAGAFEERDELVRQFGLK
jgi:mannose-6-phosphate isomerase-like protein (cupin superfamily)